MAVPATMGAIADTGVGDLILNVSGSVKGKGIAMSFDFARKCRIAAVALCMSLLAATQVTALDYNDVKNLLANKVSEQVIVNMLNQQDDPVEVTEAQVNELRQLGASETLLAGLDFTPAAATAAPATAGESWTYVDENGTVYSSGDAPATLVQQAPQTVVTDPSGVVYYDPNATYYDPSSPVVVTSPPAVVYESPTYVEVPTYVYPTYPRRGSSWSFSIGIGGGDRRHYRGGPRGHRGRW